MDGVRGEERKDVVNLELFLLNTDLFVSTMHIEREERGEIEGDSFNTSCFNGITIGKIQMSWSCGQPFPSNYLRIKESKMDNCLPQVYFLPILLFFEVNFDPICK